MRPTDDRGINIFHLECFRGILAIIPPYLCERGDKAFNVLRTIADRHIGEQIRNVSELRLDVVVITQDVVDLNACKPGRPRENRKLCCVKIVDCRAVNQLAPIGIVVADCIDLVASIGNEVNDLVNDLPPAQCQIAAADVEARKKQIGCARRLCDIDDLMDVAERHRVRTEQERTLGQRTTRFMHADGCHICACIHRCNGQTITEIEMCSMCLVHEYLHAVGVCEFCNRTQIGADAVIRRIVDKDSLSVRMTRDRGGDILHAHA